MNDKNDTTGEVNMEGWNTDLVCRKCGEVFEAAKGRWKSSATLCPVCYRGREKQRWDEATRIRQEAAALRAPVIGTRCQLCGGLLGKEKWGGGTTPSPLCLKCRVTTCEKCKGYVMCAAPGRIWDKRPLPCEWPSRLDLDLMGGQVEVVRGERPGTSWKGEW